VVKPKSADDYIGRPNRSNTNNKSEPQAMICHFQIEFIAAATGHDSYVWKVQDTAYSLTLAVGVHMTPKN